MTEKTAKPPERDMDPHRLARTILGRRWRDQNNRIKLRFWRGEWWRWTECDTSASPTKS
jgi:hypothetical protein